MRKMRIMFALTAFVCGWESSVFSKKLTLTNSQEGSKFGASFDFFTQSKNGREVLNLVVGAPKLNVQAGYTGRLYSYEIDNQCTSETCHESPLLFEADQGTLMNNIFRGIREENLLVHNKFLGASVKVDDSGALWFCDPRATAAAMCDRRDHEDLDDGETRCKTLKRTEDMESSLERHDFPVGSCYYVKNIKGQIDALKNGNIESTAISWISPCFTYLTPITPTGGHSLPTIYWKNGTQEYGRYGRNYDQGMMSMNCHFGSSINEFNSNVFVGAPKNHNQGNTFAFSTSDFPSKALLMVAGMQQVENSIKKKDFLSFSKPEYTSESMTPDFIKQKEAGGRRGSNIASISIDGVDFLLEVEDRGLNDQHKRTGCVNFLKRQREYEWDGMPESYQHTSEALKSRSTRVCGTFSHESFGKAIQVVDINNDGLEDLIVGAPHYSEKRKYDIGRIFIYIQRDGQLDDIDPKILLGVDQEGRFGSAIEHVGDQDGDGFNDVVISSPYAEKNKGSLGKLYLIYGGKFTIKEAEEASADDFCLMDKTDVGEVDGYSPSGDFKALGSKMRYKTGEENQLFVTAGESDMIYLFNLKPMFKLKLYWDDNSILDRENNKLQADICVKMTDKPLEAPNTVSVSVTIELDSRLVGDKSLPGNRIQKNIEIKTRRSSGFCEPVSIAISKVLQDCNTGPFELAVVDAELIIRNEQEMFGYTFGCKSRLPRHFVEIEGNESNNPKINIDLQMDKEETIVQSVNVPAERFDGQLTVKLENSLLMRPSIMMEFEEGQLSFDMTSDNDWYIDACPNDFSCGNTYFGRKCVFKSLGFAMNDGERQKANFAFDIKADGTSKELGYSAKIMSCGKCQEIMNCDGNECSKKISVIQENLLDPSTAKLGVTPDETMCGEDNENETGSEEIVRISVSSLISGVSPVKAGNLAVVTTITEAGIFENPCKQDAGFVSGTLTMRKPTCDSDKGKLMIKVESEQDLLPSLLSEVDVNFHLTKKLSTSSCNGNSTITSQILISSPILDNDEIVAPKPVTLHLKNVVQTAGPTIWIVIGLCGFVLLLVVLLLVKKTHKEEPNYATATATKGAEPQERVDY